MKKQTRIDAQTMPSLSTSTSIKKNGIHIIADFFECQNGTETMLNAQKLEKICSSAVQISKLTEVGKLFYKFPKSGVTGIILLAESHLAIHTWPERKYLTLDIFVCNFMKENVQKAENVYKIIHEFFLPQSHQKQNILR